MIPLLIVGLTLVIVGLIEGWRGHCGLATDACVVMGGFAFGYAFFSLAL